MTNQAKLNSVITREIDNSPCDYTEVIAVLKSQLAWMRKARKDEHDVKREERRVIRRSLGYARQGSK